MIDLIIEILRGSKSVRMQGHVLVNGVTDNIKFKSSISKKMAAMLRFTERQATAILEMRLYRLIGLEIKALRAEHEQTLKNIARFEDILNNYDSMAGVIIEELTALRKNMPANAAQSLKMQKRRSMRRRRSKSRKLFS